MSKNKEAKQLLATAAQALESAGADLRTRIQQRLVRQDELNREANLALDVARVALEQGDTEYYHTHIKIAEEAAFKALRISDKAYDLSREFEDLRQENNRMLDLYDIDSGIAFEERRQNRHRSIQVAEVLGVVGLGVYTIGQVVSYTHLGEPAASIPLVHPDVWVPTLIAGAGFVDAWNRQGIINNSKYYNAQDKNALIWSAAGFLDHMEERKLVIY